MLCGRTGFSRMMSGENVILIYILVLVNSMVTKSVLVRAMEGILAVLRIKWLHTAFFE